MGRKSLAGERINQILDAFEECIIEHGLSGATLHCTAEQAQLNIGMIHHYIGNRDDLLRAIVNRLSERTEQETAMFIKKTPAHLRLPYLLQYLFEEKHESRTNRIINELFTASTHNLFIQKLLQEINQLYQKLIAAEIKQTYPHLTVTRCQKLAFTLLSMAYGAGLLVKIGFDSKQKLIVLQDAYLLLQTAVNQNNDGRS